MQLTINVHSAEELRELSIMLEDFEKSRRLGLKFKEEQLELPLPEPTPEPTPEPKPDAVPSVTELRAAVSTYAEKHGTAAAKKLLDQFGGGISKIESGDDKIKLLAICQE